ncbi:4Fe-4S dicluster domain-containing protein [Chromobacterium sp. IIBBL 290-4]|uniref:4Fe-4S dicluster domain-containing protein n=1 Tax=Chromobacterium sp. IIBBL 290-4 TaxID=2953890 RepID=UPI0020B8FB84|nr:4Fe-4S dicluster domain-containing protein [Chromobacterium sp. IIBBL 290-4]UTH73051.1 4Fe-4S dicluster domain-containing protein [Chromobacterium sp. IIBBL 290-4]
MAACSALHRAAGLQAHPRLAVTRTASVTAPVLCRHCDDAPCARVCPVAAISLSGRSVDLNETLCIGCKLCAIACPFGAIQLSGTPCDGVAAVSPAWQAPQAEAGPSAAPHNSNATLSPLLAWEPGVKAIAIKCDLCQGLADGPECMRVCPTQALRLEDNDALARAASPRRQAALHSLGEDVNLPEERS